MNTTHPWAQEIVDLLAANGFKHVADDLLGVENMDGFHVSLAAGHDGLGDQIYRMLANHGYMMTAPNECTALISKDTNNRKGLGLVVEDDDEDDPSYYIRIIDLDF